jgi:ATP-binding cassette subfamily C exporter for protease/lipase
MSAGQTRPTGGELRRMLMSFKPEIAWVAIFSFFANALMLTPTLYMLQVFDRVLLSGSQLTLIALTLIMVLFFSVMAFAEWVRSRLLVRASARFDDALSRRVFNAAYEARLAAVRSTTPAQPLSDLTTIRQYLTGNGAFAFFDLPWISIYIAVLFLMHPVLGWTALAFAVLLCLLAFAGHRYTQAGHKQAADGVIDVNNFLYAKSRNAETVEAMGMLGNLRRLWLHLHRQQLASAGAAFERAHRLQALTKFVQYTQQSIILGVGALLALKGEIGVGAMIASNALLGQALRPVGALVGSWRQFIEARQAWGRLDAVMAAHPERDASRSAPTLTGQVAIRALMPEAPGRTQPILQSISAEFKAGEVVAIVGPSGAGKSTLARCLVGIWPGVRQQVFIDGTALEDWSRDSLGPQVGYLPQDIELMDGTIAENIARFGPLESQAVIEAATRTGLHEMILRMPKGYDTPMGEAGGMLSGGQRQRIGLARALYGNPRIVVLDEPNANLDDVGEAALVKSVRDARARGTTVFMIVHQPHLLVVADRVLLLEQGRIKHFGPVVVQKAAPQIENPA